MAMTKCRDCGKKISKRAKTCPECGAPNKKRTSATTYFVLLVIIIVTFASINSNSPSSGAAISAPRTHSSISISSSDVGKPWTGQNWPFTVSKGTLACAADAVTFSANGTTYAVNGFASSRGYADIAPIWRDNASIPGTKINIGAVLDPGLTLCR